ncbi:MAG: molybdate ABC transporter substrate-binding protein [Bacillota bacterium]
MGKTKAIAATIIIIIALILGVIAAGSPGHVPVRELNLFAASSLTPAFDEITAAFENLHGGVRIRKNYTGTQLLRYQIEQGLPADIIAFAGRKHIDSLIDQGFVEDRQNFAENLVVIAVSPAADIGIEELGDLVKPHRLLLASPRVPLGETSNEILTNGESIYGESFSTKVLANVVSVENSARQVISKLFLGEADAALVYLSDVKSRPELSLTIIPVPDGLYNPVEYYIAPLENDSNLNDAKEFVNFVMSPAGQDILGSHFLLPRGEESRQ